MTLANLLLKVKEYNAVAVVDDGDEITATRDMLARSLHPQFFARNVDCIHTDHAGTLVVELAEEENRDDDSPYNL